MEMNVCCDVSVTWHKDLIKTSNKHFKRKHFEIILNYWKVAKDSIVLMIFVLLFLTQTDLNSMYLRMVLNLLICLHIGHSVMHVLLELPSDVNSYINCSTNSEDITGQVFGTIKLQLLGFHLFV